MARVVNSGTLRPKVNRAGGIAAYALVLTVVAAVVLAILTATTNASPLERSMHITGVVAVTLYATGLTPGASYTPVWRVFRNDSDTAPAFSYFRSPVVASSSGYLSTSVPLQQLADYANGDVPYAVEMLLEQPGPSGFLEPVSDLSGDELCTRVDVWEYGPQEDCSS